MGRRHCWEAAEPPASTPVCSPPAGSSKIFIHLWSCSAEQPVPAWRAPDTWTDESKVGDTHTVSFLKASAQPALCPAPGLPSCLLHCLIMFTAAEARGQVSLKGSAAQYCSADGRDADGEGHRAQHQVCKLQEHKPQVEPKYMHYIQVWCSMAAPPHLQAIPACAAPPVRQTGTAAASSQGPRDRG